MSDETELVVGTIGAVVQRKADTWQIMVTPDGSDKERGLWTKDVNLADAVGTKFGQHGAFACRISEYTGRDGQPTRSLWITKLEDGAAPAPAPTDAAAYVQQNRATAGSGEMSKEDWRLKDDAIHMTALIKAAADSLKHTIPSAPTAEELADFNIRVTTLAHRWHVVVTAIRDHPTDDDIPF